MKIKVTKCFEYGYEYGDNIENPVFISLLEDEGRFKRGTYRTDLSQIQNWLDELNADIDSEWTRDSKQTCGENIEFKHFYKKGTKYILGHIEKRYQRATNQIKN